MQQLKQLSRKSVAYATEEIFTVNEEDVYE